MLGRLNPLRASDDVSAKISFFTSLGENHTTLTKSDPNGSKVEAYLSTVSR